jgi:hypothetical protein
MPTLTYYDENVITPGPTDPTGIIIKPQTRDTVNSIGTTTFTYTAATGYFNNPTATSLSLLVNVQVTMPAFANIWYIYFISTNGGSPVTLWQNTGSGGVGTNAYIQSIVLPAGHSFYIRVGNSASGNASIKSRIQVTQLDYLLGLTGATGVIGASGPAGATGYTGASGPVAYQFTLVPTPNVTIPTPNSILKGPTNNGFVDSVLTLEGYSFAFLTFVAAALTGTGQLVGLTVNGQSPGLLNYGFSFNAASGTFRIYDYTGGGPTGSSISYTSSSVFTVEAVANGINYYKDGALIVVNAAPPSGYFQARFDLIKPGDSITDISFGFASLGPVGPQGPNGDSLNIIDSGNSYTDDSGGSVILFNVATFTEQPSVVVTLSGGIPGFITVDSISTTDFTVYTYDTTLTPAAYTFTWIAIQTL